MSDRGRVLIVDDDTSSATSLQVLLEREDYAVGRLAAGEGALDGVVAFAPNLVMLSGHLRDADPFQLRESLGREVATRDIPVVFMVTHDDAEVRFRGLESGDDLVVKPIEEREVLARVERQVTVSKVRMALRESEAKFRSVMESAIDAIISGDAEGFIRSWNSAASALFGFNEDEVLGQPIEIIIPERFRQQHQQGMHRVTSGGPSRVIGKTVELAALRKDGTEFPVELSLATWFLDDTRYYTGIIRDISERKQAEQKFRSVTESAIDAIISADHRGEIVSWNRAATRILGYSEEEALGQRLELIIPERFHQPHRDGMARFTATGEGHVIGTTVELFALTKDHGEVPIELSLSTWTVKEERYYTGIIRDIGERKRAEEALRQSERALRERTLELKSKNEVLEETLRQLHEAHDQLIIQEKMASLGRLSAGMAHELNNPASAAQRSAAQLQTTLVQLERLQLELSRLNLEPAQLERLAELDRLAKERAREPVTLDALDLSDREMEVESWLAQRGITANGELAPGVVSLGFDDVDLATLMEGFPGQQFQVVVEWLTCIHTIFSLVSEIGLATGRVAEIVKALKTYSYMDQAPIQSVDVRDGLDSTLIILKGNMKGGVKVVREYAHDVPTIQAYASELNQVWTNILDNAIDAMGGHGRLTLRVRQEDRWVVVEIVDDGPGIPREIQSKIFDPFFTTKGPGHGTGLGLSISRKLVVQRHHGQISVTSRPGETCFAVRLPTDLEPAAELPPNEE